MKFDQPIYVGEVESKEDFEEYCLKPAMHMRGIIKHQISLIDYEFRNELPDIKIK